MVSRKVVKRMPRFGENKVAAIVAIKVQGVHFFAPHHNKANHNKANHNKERVAILKGIDLEVRQGEHIALTGVSGAGKTSLLMLLAGLEVAQRGTIEIFAHNIARLSERARTAFRRDNLGIVFQSFYLLQNLTALENTALALEFARNSEAREIAARCLQRVGLRHRLHHYPWQLSGGEQQRVALARACALSPRILLADEPTGNLDKETGELVADTLFAQARDKNLILVTHNKFLAERCARRLEISDGRIVSDSSP